MSKYAQSHTTFQNMSTLYDVASSGSVENLLDLLSNDTADVDERHEGDGWTPLMVASEEGYLRIVRVLLKYGASVSANTDRGHTALHASVYSKRLAVTKALIKAGADIEAKATCSTNSKKVSGHTPLHLAAGGGFSEGVKVLIKAGAMIESCLENGATPLYLAACCGHTEAVKILVQAGADPTKTVYKHFPLDVAAQEGHLPVVRELVQKFGINGCTSGGGMDALEAAAFEGHADIVAFLCDFGVVDNEGLAFCSAVEGKSRACIDLLLERRGGNEGMDATAYLNIAEGNDSPLLCTFHIGGCAATRMARFLLDNGANTTQKVTFHLNALGTVKATPLVAAILTFNHAENRTGFDGLKGVIRLLHQVDAVHAMSWRWPSNTNRTKGGKREEKSAAIGRMLPLMKMRAGRPKVLLGALCRYSRKSEVLGDMHVASL